MRERIVIALLRLSYELDRLACFHAHRCPCQGERIDPGPRHLLVCPWRDPRYPEYCSLSGLPGKANRYDVSSEYDA